MWLTVLVVVTALIAVALLWLLRKKNNDLYDAIDKLLVVVAEMDNAYGEVQESNERLVQRNIALKLVNNWHEAREPYFVDLYQAAHLLTEVFDEQKYDAIMAMGIETSNGWVPSKQGVDAIKLHLKNARESVQAGRSAIRQLIEWERDNPPEGSNG